MLFSIFNILYKFNNALYKTLYKNEFLYFEHMYILMKAS